MKSTLVYFIFTFTLVGVTYASIKYKMDRTLPGYMPAGLSDKDIPPGVIKKNNGKCNKLDTRIATDGCNICHCDLNELKFVCTTKLCYFNTRKFIKEGDSCRFPGAVHVGKKFISCRCNADGIMYRCISRNPSARSKNIEKKYLIF